MYSHKRSLHGLSKKIVTNKRAVILNYKNKMKKSPKRLTRYVKVDFKIIGTKIQTIDNYFDNFFYHSSIKAAIF